MARSEPKGPWEAHKLGTLPQRLLASPLYLARFGTPQSPKELQQHRLLVWEGPDGRVDQLPLTDGARLDVTPWVRMNDILVLRRCAAEGAGIAFTPDAPASAAIEGMVPVLKDTVRGRVNVWLLVPTAIVAMPQVRLAIDQVLRIFSAMGE
jgi:DNA-binding transcriptional LysR family regulator